MADRQLVYLGDCGWCRRELLATRRDARYCSKSCRQAAHRTGIRRAELDRDATPARLAYADPPYPGMAHLYRGHPDYAGEVDHAELIGRLSTYDGWALSTSADALPEVLRDASRLESRRVAVAAWVKGPRPHPLAAIVSSWEPVLYVPARSLRDPSGAATPDALVGVASRGRPTLPTAVLGMKPPAFCTWLFALLGARPGDELADLFPGSGIVAWSWARWTGAA
jgi:hypothetical protein